MNSEQAVSWVIQRLEETLVDYMLVGAFSSNLYGVPRSTKDADVVVAFGTESIVEFCRSLGEDFVLDRQMMMEMFTASTRNIVRFKPNNFDIELFHLGDDAHHQERFARRRRQHIPEFKREVWVQTAEDLIIQKVRWARRKDLDDVVNVISVSGDLMNWDYVHGWTERHGTRDLLEQLRREAQS
jgi:hypothetical protein